MVLNRIWFGMFLIAIALGFYKTFVLGDYSVMKEMIDSLSSSAKLGFELSLYLTGAMCLWLGIMRVGEKGGAIGLLTRGVTPLFLRLFPEIPKNHPSIGSMMMNFSANMLGLDNAATPLGLKAMKELQEINPTKDRASNAQIMFLVLNTSGLTIIPISIFALRSGCRITNRSFFTHSNFHIYSLLGRFDICVNQTKNQYFKCNCADLYWRLIFIDRFVALLCGRTSEPR